MKVYYKHGFSVVELLIVIGLLTIAVGYFCSNLMPKLEFCGRVLRKENERRLADSVQTLDIVDERETKETIGQRLRNAGVLLDDFNIDPELLESVANQQAEEASKRPVMLSSWNKAGLGKDMFHPGIETQSPADAAEPSYKSDNQIFSKWNQNTLQQAADLLCDLPQDSL